MRIAMIYLLAIVAAEMVTVLIQPMWGIVLHTAVLVAVISHSALAKGLSLRLRQLVLSLALAPLVRIMSLVMPLVSIPQVLWYPIIYTPLIVAAVVVARILGYRAGQVGLGWGSAPIQTQLAVALTGGLFGVAEYFILKPPAMAIELSFQAIGLLALFFLLFTGFGEEFMFRGILQRTATEVFRDWGIIYVGFLFAILHIGFLSWLDVFFVFIVALFFGWVVKKTGSLLGVTLSHGLTNILLYLILPFLF